jgi:tRNA(Ile)-lysidine synthase
MAEPKSRPTTAPEAARKITAALAASLATLPQSAPRLCVALSGGRDSVVLLHALSRLREGHSFSLSALHVHHGISANADAWAAFCGELCAAWDIPLAIVRVEVPRASGEGLEAAARRLRHEVFVEVDADALLLAHHRDDQAETVLLNLLRGAGVAGAAGMLPVRAQARGPYLVRPLLGFARAALEAYASEHELRWICDESNDDLHFRRNFLRHEIVPRLEAKFSGAGEALARAAAHFAEGAALLDELARIDRAASAPNPDGRIAVAGFNGLGEARARNLLRVEIAAAGFRAPEARWISEALKQLATADSSSQICLATPDFELHVYRGEIHLNAKRILPPAAAQYWKGESDLPWGAGRVRFVATTGSGIRRAALDGEVVLQPRAGGERLKPHAGRPRRSLRNLLQEGGVPPWERARLPYLWCEGRLAWVGGVGVDASFACAADEAGILPVWESSTSPST